MPTSLSLGIEHREAAHLGFAHALGDGLDVVGVARADDVAAHQVAHTAVGALAGGYAAYGDVAVGDHADHLVAVAHRDRSGIGGQHEARRVLCLWSGGRSRPAGHYVADGGHVIFS